ncbi:aldehyde dehydrogenase family protein [Planobispora takensis]|uniref:aldehyde dehydrogenase family protein n=1 Tax=Planobispora takensis TaxID=1367882 RepID=UPI0035A2372F
MLAGRPGPQAHPGAGGAQLLGVWEYGDRETLTGQIRKSFDYAKQRCTAYPRFVVQRSSFHDFLTAYLPAVRSVRFGHPPAVESPGDPPPDLGFGPLIAGAKAKELTDQIDEAIAKGDIPLHRGSVAEGRFLRGQDTSAYLAPTTILAPPPSSPLFRAEPFGPVDTVVLVDTEAELLAAMNAGNGALVATISCGEEETARRPSRSSRREPVKRERIRRSWVTTTSAPA